MQRTYKVKYKNEITIKNGVRTVKYFASEDMKYLGKIEVVYGEKNSISAYDANDKKYDEEFDNGVEARNFLTSFHKENK